MFPLGLMNDSPCHFEQSVAIIDTQSSSPGCLVGFDASAPRQRHLSWYVRHVNPLPELLLPRLRSADPDSQLYSDKNRFPGHVNLLFNDETVVPPILDSHFSVYDHDFDQYLGLTPPVGHSLRNNGSSVESTFTDRRVKRENIKSESKTKYYRNPQQRQRHCVAQREYRAKMKRGFELLRNRIPQHYLSSPRPKISKVNTMTLATRYIKELTDQLAQKGDYAINSGGET